MSPLATATPIATLFDINPIPYFPFSPGIELWLLLGAGVFILLILSCLSIFFSRRRTLELNGADYNYKQCRALLNSSQLSADRLNLGLTFAKRALAIRTQLPVTAFSAQELTDLGLKHPTLADLVKVLVECDYFRYRPVFLEQHSKIELLRDELLARLSGYFESDSAPSSDKGGN